MLLHDCGVQFGKYRDFNDGISDKRRRELQELALLRPVMACPHAPALRTVFVCHLPLDHPSRPLVPNKVKI